MTSSGSHPPSWSERSPMRPNRQIREPLRQRILLRKRIREM
jgi:hypothetical protein